MLNIHNLFHALHLLKISLFLMSEFLVLSYLLITQNRLLVISKILYISGYSVYSGTEYCRQYYENFFQSFPQIL